MNDSTRRPLPAPWDLIIPLITKIFVWSLFIAVLYLLRSFFLLIFLTFVFAYTQAHAVERLLPKIKVRWVTVLLVTLFLLSTIGALGAYLVPEVRRQAEEFTFKYPAYLQAFDTELLKLSERYPVLGETVPGIQELARSRESEQRWWDAKQSPSGHAIRQLFGFGESATGEANLKETLNTLKDIGGRLVAIASAFLLSLLFSFLIVLDLPRLSASVQRIGESRMAFLYHEVAGSVRDLGRVMGQALEAQLMIALLNSALTAVALTALGLAGKLAFFSVIVFFCSFIPVAGVFISSIPICLYALQSSGPGLMLLTILAITVVHLIEAYVLNPKIFGKHLHLNPVIVLIILTIGGKLFHVWGLLLGLPVCTYIFGHAIWNGAPRATRAHHG